jgi:nitroreductase
MKHPNMALIDAIRSRRSCRAFSSRPVPLEIVRELLTSAGRAPSGGNLQPWHVHVLTGHALDDFVAVVEMEAREHPRGQGAEYMVYPPDLWDPYRSRRYRCGEDLYASLGLARGDKPARFRQMAQNLRFFGAPVGLFFSVDRRFDAGQWADLGLFMQTFMLLARAYDLDTCAQESWAGWHRTVAGHLGFPPEHQLFCGMALGYADLTHPINGFRTERAALQEYATFIGFDG